MKVLGTTFPDPQRQSWTLDQGWSPANSYTMEICACVRAFGNVMGVCHTHTTL